MKLAHAGNNQHGWSPLASLCASCQLHGRGDSPALKTAASQPFAHRDPGGFSAGTSRAAPTSCSGSSAGEKVKAGQGTKAAGVAVNSVERWLLAGRRFSKKICGSRDAERRRNLRVSCADAPVSGGETEARGFAQHNRMKDSRGDRALGPDCAQGFVLPRRLNHSL